VLTLDQAVGINDAVPFLAGVGLKPEHVGAILDTLPRIGIVEVHAENYMGAGGPPHRHLTAIRDRYPLSIHGVGLSLGGAQDLDAAHVDRLVRLVRRYEPTWISEHLAWSSHGPLFLNDLLPVPYTSAALEHVVNHIDQVQSALGRRILLENPATYVAFEASCYEETNFIAEIANRTGCGLLLDVNNVHVSAINHGRDPESYLAAYPLYQVEEIHLAGHSPRLDANGVAMLVDSHDRPIAEPVWSLFRNALTRTGPVPTLVERDANIPPWQEIYAEVRHAQSYLEKA
jgi:hypothetical protein